MTLRQRRMSENVIISSGVNYENHTNITSFTTAHTSLTIRIFYRTYHTEKGMESMTRMIPKPIHEQVMEEISTYDREEKLNEIAEELWKVKPKVALWFCIEFQLPY